MSTYLRAVVTTRCPMACAYCHMEGDPAVRGAEGGLPTDTLVALLRAGVQSGVRKLKLLGGEPLLRADLPAVIRAVARPDLDISVITSGTAPVANLRACVEAGLSRANMSIHGWGEAAFARRGGGAATRRRRDETLAVLLAWGRPLKLNYVYGGPGDREDLAGLLEWAAGERVVVGVLDDLGREDLGPAAIVDVLRALRGPEARSRVEPDPHSLPTLRLHWDDGLEVEVKDQHLGEHAPWTACRACPKRARCGEGIDAVRLTHTGMLRPCMDRTDLGVPLLPVLAAGGEPAVVATWRRYVGEVRA
ncbi:MAG: radical SAM protein [Myxococcota bacterium]